MKKVFSRVSVEDLPVVVQEVLCGVVPHKEHATILALEGDLGAGKTTFVQYLAKELGIKGHVTSPTFVLMQKYMTGDSRFDQLVHIDAYRMEKPDEINHIGWNHLVQTPNTLIVIEWPKRVEGFLSAERYSVVFERINEETRSITFSKSS